MSGENKKVRSRKRKPSKLLHWLNTEGRRYCAVALCASLIAGNLGQFASIANDGNDSDFEFKMSRLSIYEALQEAVANGNTVDKEFKFQGIEAEAYDSLMEAYGTLYELFPEIKGGAKHVDLRVFTRLTGDIALDGTYQIDGEEEVIFMLNNTLDVEKTATIMIDDKKTEPIVLTPKSAIAVSDEEDPYISASEFKQENEEESEVTTDDTGVSIVEDETEKESEEVVIEVESEDTSNIEESDDEIEEVEVEIEAVASISSHEVYRVASSATPSDAEKEETATPSNATDSNADPTELDGQAYKAVLMDGTAANAFVTTLEELDVSNLLVLMASPANAGKMHTAEIDGVIVKAWVNNGILPDDAQLVVTKLDAKNNAEQYQSAVEALEQSGTQYGGMMALDISFQNEEGEEIEPDGNVQVSIEMAKEALPENVSADMLTVQHLKETEEGAVEVQTVADTTVETDGTVEEKEDATIAAAFEVESFSTFTITWTGNSYQTNFVMNLHYKDEAGNDITISENTGLTVTAGETIVFKDRVNILPTSRYDYQYAYYLDETKGEIKVTDATLKINWVRSYYGYGGYYKYVLTLTTENGGKETIEYKESELKTPDIYLVYKRHAATAETKTELQRSKTVVKPDNAGIDEYDLTLTVSGAVGSITDPVDVDILLILDTSGSMKYKVGSDTSGSADDETRRIDKVAAAVKNLAESIEETQGAVNARYSIVGFAGYNQTQVITPWGEASSSELKSTITGITPTGGTNYQRAIEVGKDQLSEAAELRPYAKKIVVFLTDGVPTYYSYYSYRDEHPGRPGSSGSSDGSWGDKGNGSSYDSTAQEKAESEIKNLTCDAFYAVGVFAESEDGKKTQEEKCLEDLCSNADKALVKESYATSNTEGLNNAFKQIAGEVNTILCDHVTVEDTLSEYVDFVKAEDTPVNENLQIVVEDAEGNVVVVDKDADGNVVNKKLQGNGTLTIPKTSKNNSAEETGRTLTATYDEDSKQIKLKFPDSYKLEAGWTYKVVARIKVSDAAYAEYQNNEGAYPSGVFGEAYTGTHAGQSGFYSNEAESAKVSYKYNEENKTLYYPMPVVQLSLGELIIKKEIQIDGVTNMQAELETENSNMNALLKALTFTAKSEHDNPTIPSPGAEDSGWIITPNGEKLLLEYHLENRIPGEKYTVTENESSAKIEGYQVTTDVKLNTDAATTGYKAENVEIKRGTEQTVTFTNTYKPSLKLTVTKVVDGKLGDRNKAFTFTVEVKRNNIDITSDLYPNNENTFTLKHGETSKEFGQLRKDDIVTITETDATDYDTVVWVGENEPADISKDKKWSITIDSSNIEVNFKNTKDPEINTGIFLDSMPYVIILAAAAVGAAFYFVRKKKEDDLD